MKNLYQYALLEAIEKSKLSAIILSKKYASSSWCLIELAHILECKEKYGQLVIPIFYNINPSDVRKQRGSYGDAFAQHENRFKDSMDKVCKWRKALMTVANLSGFDYSNKKRTEADLLNTIVDDIRTQLIRKLSFGLNGLVGIESRIEEVEFLLCLNDSLVVSTLGIWGMCGVGKTTLAKFVFHELSSKFDACCLLKNIRERSEQADGRDSLEKTLLRDILMEKDLSIGSTFVREWLNRTKVLIVFDDVSDSRQIDHLAGGYVQYGPGSRFIITSRNRSVLKKTVEDDKIYKVGGLKLDDALQLFHLHAFKDNCPTSEYAELSAGVVDYAGGIPLALQILGSLFLPCESKEEWEDMFNKLKKIPSKEIQNAFRLCYDGLEIHEQEVFLDIACFYKGKSTEYVKRMLGIRGFFALAGIRVLIDKSLISIDSTRETIGMHDLLKEMGWAIVREQCVEEPGKRNFSF